jgi:predicted ATPase
MIKKVELTNFYSFGKTTIELHPETNILIGINGSGKSNFLKALRLLKEGMVGMGLRKYILDFLGGFNNMFHKASSEKDANSQRTISLEFTIDASILKKYSEHEVFSSDIIYTISIVESPGLKNYTVNESLGSKNGDHFLTFEDGKLFSFSLNSNKAWRFSSIDGWAWTRMEDFDSGNLALRYMLIYDDTPSMRAINAFRKGVRDIVIYDYFDTTPNSLIRRPILPTSENRLSSGGANLTQSLNTLKINHKDFYRKVVEMLREVNPNFEGFDFNFIGGNIELMLEERGFNSSIHVSNISDGTLRYLCLLAIVCNPNRGKLICIDEPELGLHPDMILNLANAIKDASANSTFVILTHSENLLNYFDIENLRVFEKDEQNGTIVKSFSTDQFAEWYEDYTIGQMWKQGDFGGVRYGN